MKIVILDGYTENPGDLSWGELEKLGELTVYDRTSLTDEAEIISRIGDAEVVLTNKTPISRRTFDACPGIKFVAMLATGYNVVDVAYAREKGISVSNVPVYGTRSVSQFAIALLLEVCHHIGHHDRTVHEGKWENCADWCYWDYPLIELADKTYGLLGCGNIGIHTAEVAKALGMHVIAYDARETEAGHALGVEYVTLDELFARSDVLGLQMPLFPFNTGIINKENIAKMKDGVIIINNSRGQMVVEQDLADALNSGKVAAAGLDVVSTEPIRGDNPLLKAKNCILTPHMSWGAKESRQRIMDCTVDNVKAYLAGAPINVVNWRETIPGPEAKPPGRGSCCMGSGGEEAAHWATSVSSETTRASRVRGRTTSLPLSRAKSSFISWVKPMQSSTTRSPSRSLTCRAAASRSAMGP